MQWLPLGISMPTSHASSMEMEVEYLMEAPEKLVSLPLDAGVAKELVCPVCDAVIFPGLALQRHLCSQHLDLLSYVCDDCGSSFLTTKNLSSHISLIHQDPQVKCHFCDY